MKGDGPSPPLGLAGQHTSKAPYPHQWLWEALTSCWAGWLPLMHLPCHLARSKPGSCGGLPWGPSHELFIWAATGPHHGSWHAFTPESRAHLGRVGWEGCWDVGCSQSPTWMPVVPRIPVEQVLP